MISRGSRYNIWNSKEWPLAHSKLGVDSSYETEDAPYAQGHQFNFWYGGHDIATEDGTAKYQWIHLCDPRALYYGVTAGLFFQMMSNNLIVESAGMNGVRIRPAKLDTSGGAGWRYFVE